MPSYLGLHEMLEVQELLTFKSLCLTKATTMSGLVQDETLKNILLQDVKIGLEHVQQLEGFLTKRGNQQ